MQVPVLEDQVEAERILYQCWQYIYIYICEPFPRCQIFLVITLEKYKETGGF